MKPFVPRVMLLPSAEPDVLDTQTDIALIAYPIVLDVPVGGIEQTVESQRV